VFASVLREDAILSMPPMSAWFSGQDAIALFASSLRSTMGELKLVPIVAAGGPALAAYLRAPGETLYRPAAIHVVRIEGDRIAEVHAFLLPHLFARFGAPAELA
jgi:RNA polymerase sigma-70 factor, ECF subfamily